jgi:hypothetical protein
MQKPKLLQRGNETVFGIETKATRSHYDASRMDRPGMGR